jgi:integrase
MSVLDQSQNQDTQNEEDVYFNFINSIKSEVTKRIYENDIKLYLNFCNLTKLSELLTITDPQKQIIKYIMSLREKGLATNSISTLLLGIYHLYEMNDIPLNKKKINMFKGEFTGKVIDRAYTHEEIRKVLDVSDLRMKIMILLMVSSGMRIGALPSLRIRNLEKIDSDSIYKITVYAGSNASYYTFCTPECSSFIDAYLEYRTQNGEKLDNDSFLIRDQFDISDLEQIRNKSKGITINTMESIVGIILLKAGLRTLDHISKSKRKEVAKCHGFRKFFTTQAVNSKVNPEIREMLLGHKIGLTGSYYRPTEQEMYEEYQKAIDNLTINEEFRLRKKVKILEVEKSRLDQLELTIKRLEERYRKDANLGSR